MEVALTPTLAQATEAMGATDETGEYTHNTEYQRSFSQCEKLLDNQGEFYSDKLVKEDNIRYDKLLRHLYIQLWDPARL